jgi:hypothetical protein
LFLACFRKCPFPFIERGTVVLDFILTRLSVLSWNSTRLSSSLELGDLAHGELHDLTTLHPDIAKLAVGKLLQLVNGGETPEAVAKPCQSAADQRAAKGLAAAVEGKSG